MVVGIVTLWDERLSWFALGGIIALFAMIFVRGIMVRRHYERWMDDLARATFRLLRPSPVRRTTTWEDWKEGGGRT